MLTIMMIRTKSLKYAVDARWERE